MAGKQADIKVGVITNYDDKGLKQAQTGLSGFKTSISEADGFTGKFKAGFASLSSTVSSALSGPAGIAAIGGIFAAAGKFAFDAVSKFSELGVAIGKLADSTGLSADAASRWVEVAGDIGIDAGTLESGIGKLNKTLGNTPALFTNAGIEIAKTKDGALDVNQTFLNTIDRLKAIKNPADKAALATKLLGKGWQSMAELIEQGSGTLTRSLSEVADAKVFDDVKIQKAREFREAMDKLKDVAEEFTIQIGTQLAPALSDLAGILADIGGLWGKAFGGMAGFVLGMKEFALNTFAADEATQDLVVSTEDHAAALRLQALNTDQARDATHELEDATDAAKEAQEEYKRNSDATKRVVKQNIDEMIGKWDELTGDVNDDKSWLTLQGQFDELRVKADEAFTAAATGADDAEAKGREYLIAIDDIILGTVDYAQKLKDIPPEKVTLIKAAIEAGDIDRAEQMLAILTRNRNVSISITTKGGIGYDPDPSDPYFAEGGIVPGPHGAPISATVHGGEMVLNDAQQKAVLNGGGGGTNNVTINVNAGLGTDGYQVSKAIVNSLAEYDRRNGTHIVTPAGR